MLRNFVARKKIKILSGTLLKRFFSNHKQDFDKWRKIRAMNEASPPSRSNPVIKKLDTPEFQSIFTPELNKLSEIFKKYNYEMRVAGGAVRDILMGLVPKDLDFATTATPEEMKAMFTKEEIRMINDRGEKHGTITARINDKENFEVTTLRIDVATDGRHAEVLFTKDWKLDANRRDLTINSMFLDLDGNVYDYFFGYDDLQKKRVVFVGDAGTRIREDFLRIFRYFRFYGRIADFPDCHEDGTIEAIKKNVDGLERISGERIWTEWSKILEGRFGGELTVKMLDCGVAPYIGLPEKLNVENFVTTYVKARANAVELRPITLITSLLKNEVEVLELNARLKLSVFNRELALFLVNNREEKPSVNLLKPYQHIVLNSKSKLRDTIEFVRELLKVKGDLKLLEEFDSWEVPKFPISGHDLKGHVPHGKVLGRVLIELKKIWIDDDFKTSTEDLIKRVPDLVDEFKEVGEKIKAKK
ncbi:CCA tRNA nucleotidyltransferase 1, mitochondrial [Venturia canescens]|uniref:CCA tRNA nucleotidyltransferase 1, mitochondrial n=1 Tax=Venturia canescens TaxID=32260 RepID=UPI001C9D1B7B|nr:CCA tRNA nucleotidyltransferase 1, mitochondrial [Venturia canescens]XP_043272778.1 CCA tRNA nucleotidyltransferase 1, mitochondrial [Venturia canescens]